MENIMMPVILSGQENTDNKTIEKNKIYTDSRHYKKEKKIKNRINENNMSMAIDANSQNEGLARICVAAFLTEIDPTLEEMNDIKTAVSEAVTNSIIHGYEEGPGKILIKCKLKKHTYENDDNTYTIDSIIKIEIKDKGVGIDNIEQAREPLFTTKPELDRSGMGFMFMEMFMDSVTVTSQVGVGTTVLMEKKLSRVVKYEQN